jgi:hypothetical protein
MYYSSRLLNFTHPFEYLPSERLRACLIPIIEEFDPSGDSAIWVGQGSFHLKNRSLWTEASGTAWHKFSLWLENSTTSGVYHFIERMHSRFKEFDRAYRPEIPHRAPVFRDRVNRFFRREHYPCRLQEGGPFFVVLQRRNTRS